MCLRIPILLHPVVTSEIHFYLQNSPHSSSQTTHNVPIFHKLHSDNNTNQTGELDNLCRWAHYLRWDTTLLPLTFLVTDKRRAQTSNAMVLRTLHILAKLKECHMIIQRTETLWNCVMIFYQLAVRQKNYISACTWRSAIPLNCLMRIFTSQLSYAHGSWAQTRVQIRQKCEKFHILRNNTSKPKLNAAEIRNTLNAKNPS